MKCLASNMVCKGKSRYFKFNFMGTRKSGDNHTSLGNTMIAMAIRHKFFTDEKIDYRAINLGDDNIIVSKTELTPD